MYYFSVDLYCYFSSDILNIHKYLFKKSKEWYETMFGFIKTIFTGFLKFCLQLASMVNVSSFTTCTYLNNQPCMTTVTLIDLNPDGYN